MPFGNEGLEKLTGLALSGGGFRATLFHLGALWLPPKVRPGLKCLRRVHHRGGPRVALEPPGLPGR